jgi:hypothetical protein
MRIERHYERTTDGATIARDDEGHPRFSHIQVQHTGASDGQHFSDRLVAAGLSEGWMSIKGRTLTLHATPEDLHYTILRVPGKYPSTKERSGYEVIHYYDCTLAAEQHKRYRAGKGK